MMMPRTWPTENKIMERDNVFKTLGASNHSKGDRENDDFYATDPIAIDLLEKSIGVPQYIWEPACGTGCLSKRLEDFGHEVYSSDLVDRGYGDCLDFLSTNYVPDISRHQDFGILTNPPFKLLVPFIKKGLSVLRDGQYMFMFLKTLALESRSRYEEIYKNTPPMLVLQCIDRVLCAKNAEFADCRKVLGSGAQAYAWFVWKKGSYGKTVVSWV